MLREILEDKFRNIYKEMKLKKIKLKDGWDPGFKPGTKVLCTQNTWDIRTYDILTYAGGLDSDDGWDIIFEDSSTRISAKYFEDRFKEITNWDDIKDLLDA